MNITKKAMRNAQSRSIRLALVAVMLLLAGCGRQSRVVDVEKALPLTDAEVRAILEGVAKTGDTGSGGVVRIYEKMMDEGPGRENYQEINDLLPQMIVSSSPGENQQLAKQVLELW